MNNPFEVIDARLSNIESLLLDLKHTPPTNEQKENDELLTVEQTAKFLSLSVPTIYGLISKKELPVMKRGKRCYFDKAELLAYVKAGRKRTNNEIKENAENHFAIKSKKTK
jgi:excisionase family DNA binding protein